MSNEVEASRLPSLDALISATELVTQEGYRVQLLRLIHVPEDETCFYLFEAESEQRVVDVAQRAGLRLDRVVEAVVDLSPRSTLRRHP